MLFILNTSKTMDVNASIPPGLEWTEPHQLELARVLADRISTMGRSQLAELMALSEKLTDETLANALLWGRKGRPQIPALFGFTGLIYKSLDASTLSAAQCSDAQKRVRILSGLYGLLRPFDLIEPYRLEMGHKLAVGKAENLTAFWKVPLTCELNGALTGGEPIISLAAQEYIKALDIKKLNGPVIEPFFKERHADGRLKAVAVHLKKARGELVRYALKHNALTPRDLMGFNAQGWRAAGEPPEAGPWLFTRAHQSS